MRVQWFANPYSPHVRDWLEVVAFMPNVEVEVVHIHHKNRPCSMVPGVSYICTTPRFLHWLPSSVQYVLMGLVIRVKSKAGGKKVIHAHNTSGYGLSALISGCVYGVTTYGSEIYSMEVRSTFYRWCITKILDQASFITSSSIQMTNKLHEIAVLKGRVTEFSLGVSVNIYYSKDDRERWRRKLTVGKDEKLLVVNRRASELYRTIEVVKCFNAVFNDGTYRLLVLTGDADSSYNEGLENLIDASLYVQVIHGFLSQKKLSGLLSASDFFISTPKTDQLSSSVLEGVVCQSIPVLSDLEAYLPVKKLGFVVDNYNFEADLLSVFKDMLELNVEKMNVMKVGVEKVKNDYNRVGSATVYKKLLDKLINV